MNNIEANPIIVMNNPEYVISFKLPEVFISPRRDNINAHNNGKNINFEYDYHSIYNLLIFLNYSFKNNKGKTTNEYNRK